MSFSSLIWRRDDLVVRWCCVNFQCRGVLLIWILVWQGPTALAVDAGGFFLDIFFSRLSFLLFFSLSLCETARYRLKYCLKGPLNPKQPTNQPIWRGYGRKRCHEAHLKIRFVQQPGDYRYEDGQDKKRKEKQVHCLTESNN